MNKQGEMSYAGLIVIAAICVIIGASLFASNIGNDIGAMTKKVTVTNESLDLSVARDGAGSINETYYFNLANGCPFIIGDWRLSDTSDCIITVTSITLNNGTALTASTDYVVNTTASLDGGKYGTACNHHKVGDIRFVNSSRMGFAINTVNATKVTYTYCNSGYIPANNAGARGVVALIPIFFALLIMIVPLIIIFRSRLIDMLNLR